MVENKIAGIRIFDGKEVPDGTKVMLRGGAPPGHVRVSIQLPAQEGLRDLGDLPIKNGMVHLPVKLVFLCHASEDQQAVEAIRKNLLQDGYLTWFAPEDLRGGAAWKERIDEALESANFVLVFLSGASSSKTGYYQREIKYAFEQRELRPDGERYIIPVLLEPCEPPRRFRDIHWIPLWEPDGYERLRKSLG